MPTRILIRRPPRLRYAPLPELRPHAAARGYCDTRHRAWRLAVLVRDGWTCRDCGRVCGDPREAHADHVSPVVPGTEVCRDGRSRYDVDGGQCLCVACHARKTAVDLRAARGPPGVPADQRGGEGQSWRGFVTKTHRP